MPVAFFLVEHPFLSKHSQPSSINIRGTGPVILFGGRGCLQFEVVKSTKRAPTAFIEAGRRRKRKGEVLSFETTWEQNTGVIPSGA